MRLITLGAYDERAPDLVGVADAISGNRVGDVAGARYSGVAAVSSGKVRYLPGMRHTRVSRAKFETKTCVACCGPAFVQPIKS
jgi:hypothetical protein